MLTVKFKSQILLIHMKTAITLPNIDKPLQVNQRFMNIQQVSVACIAREERRDFYLPIVRNYCYHYDVLFSRAQNTNKNDELRFTVGASQQEPIHRVIRVIEILSVFSDNIQLAEFGCKQLNFDPKKH